ncbi:hypothetical protein NW754_011319 [Fusarium falciforme]|nr:hypothetical protein NW754_011319 [Fusarium falciforme]
MAVGGTLALVGDKKQTRATLTVVATLSPEDLVIPIAAQKLSPATIASSVVQGGFDGADSDGTKPEFSDMTGLGDWSVEKPQNEATTTVKATIVFRNDDDGSRRRFDSAELRVVLVGGAGKTWKLIGEYVQLSQFALVAAIITDPSSKKKLLSAGLQARLYLKPRNKDKSTMTPETLLPLWPSRPAFTMVRAAGPREGEGDEDEDAGLRLVKATVMYNSGDAAAPAKRVVLGKTPDLEVKNLIVPLDVSQAERVKRMRIGQEIYYPSGGGGGAHPG